MVGSPLREKLTNTSSALAELRRSSAEFRRAQMSQIRAIVRAQLDRHHEQRQQLANQRVRQRPDWRAIQVQIRAKLKEISIAAGEVRKAYRGGKSSAVTCAGAPTSTVSERPLAKGAGSGSS